jgi:hypothetical protein
VWMLLWNRHKLRTGGTCSLGAGVDLGAPAPQLQAAKACGRLGVVHGVTGVMVCKGGAFLFCVCAAWRLQLACSINRHHSCC